MEFIHTAHSDLELDPELAETVREAIERVLYKRILDRTAWNVAVLIKIAFRSVHPYYTVCIHFGCPRNSQADFEDFLKGLSFYFSLLGLTDPDRLLFVLGLHSIMLTVFHCALIWK